MFGGERVGGVRRNSAMPVCRREQFNSGTLEVNFHSKVRPAFNEKKDSEANCPPALPRGDIQPRVDQKRAGDSVIILSADR